MTLINSSNNIPGWKKSKSFLEKNKNAFLYDFTLIDNLLKEKYGKKSNHDKIWLNDLYKDIPQDYGMAISVGHYVIQSEWTIGEVTICHVLRGDNFDIKHSVEYSHKTMSDLETALKKEEDKAKL